MQYPEDVDSRLWNNKKTHKYVQALNKHEEFHSFLDQKVPMERVWPDYVAIQNMLTRLYDTKRRVYSDPNAETQVNAVMTGPCFNCKGPHLSKNCRRSPNKCNKCGRLGHLEELCDRIQQFTQEGSKIGEKRESFGDRKDYTGR